MCTCIYTCGEEFVVGVQYIGVAVSAATGLCVVCVYSQYCYRGSNYVFVYIVSTDHCTSHDVCTCYAQGGYTGSEVEWLSGRHWKNQPNLTFCI